MMVMIVILVMGITTALVGALSTSALKNARLKKTSASLAEAKDALIGFAAKVAISSSDIACATTTNCPRLGDLPCPDTDNDGDAESTCGNASGSTGQNVRLGRLPWKTLGLPDLRDSSGERLWYAVSNNFKNNTRTTCNNSNLTGCLNSDTPGTINVFASDGSTLNDGSGASGAVAVIIAPGEVLQRMGESLPQNRTCTVGVDCDSNETCTTSPPTMSAKCNPVNYLDKVATEDNANFTDSSSTDGFIQGTIKTNTEDILLNDQLLVITQENIMLPIQKRVAAEVKNCLNEYGSLAQNRGGSPNDGYYPWATERSSGPPVSYNDSDKNEFGRIPDLPFVETCDETGGSNCSGWTQLGGSTQIGGMKNSWGTTCTLNNNNWWVNWKELVFYGFAHILRPHLHSGSLLSTHACPGDTTCFEVNPPSSVNDKSFVVIVAGKKLGTQLRNTNSQKADFNNYLESNNTDGNSPLEQSTASSTFNDIVVYK